MVFPKDRHNLFHTTASGQVSFGKGCGKAGFPGVYTRVASYRSWIDQKLQVIFVGESCLLVNEVPLSLY
jgi:hypothetical protein